MFSELCKDMQPNELKLLYHAEIRWLSRGKVLKQSVFQLRNKLSGFLSQERHPMAANFKDIFWLTKLSYLTAVFESTNQLNLSMQGKGCDIFEVSNKIQAFKSNLKLCKSNETKSIFFRF